MSADREAVLADVLTTAAPDVLRYLERRLGPDDAADALGDVLLVAWRRVGDLPATGDEGRLWLFGIARNAVLNARRTRARRGSLAERVRGRTAGEPHPGADRGLEVRDAIGRLEPELAELVRLVHWDGFTLADVARLLGLPPTTVSSRYRRARDELRAALAEAPDPPPGRARPVLRVVGRAPA